MKIIKELREIRAIFASVYRMVVDKSVDFSESYLVHPIGML